ncbi:MAG: TIGR00295 family protein [Candidatus Bathyarchaeia archaeon]|nr:TIGR00295 family protein [Candidatus Bathyarchaeota archaeon]
MGERLPSPEEALRILRSVGCSDEVVRHCEAVARLAVKIANKCLEKGVKLDVQLVHIGALLHDIGRSKTHSVHHAIIGAETARSLGLPEKIIAIIERHVGGGISSEEAAKLGWPKKDYIPETIEEKIVSCADKMVEGTSIVPIGETIKRFMEELGANHPAIERIKRIYHEVSTVCSLKDLHLL